MSRRQIFNVIREREKEVGMFVVEFLQQVGALLYTVINWGVFISLCCLRIRQPRWNQTCKRFMEVENAGDWGKEARAGGA